MPVWLQTLLALTVPVETALIAYLLASRKQKSATIGEYTGTFVGHLLTRVAAVEIREADCQARLMASEKAIARLEGVVQSLKYDLAEQITASAVAQQQATRDNGEG